MLGAGWEQGKSRFNYKQCSTRAPCDNGIFLYLDYININRLFVIYYILGDDSIGKTALYYFIVL
jgi:hypothetical protein